MALNGFLADNEHRAYPFLPDRDLILVHSGSGATPLPPAAVVDFACVTGLEIGVATVYLHRIARAGATLTVEFRGTNNLAAYALVFTRPLAAAEFITDFATAVLVATGLAPDTPCADPLVWEGTLTTGRLEDLAALLADGDTLTAADGAIPVEPARIQDLAGTYVRSLNLANVNRLHATAPPGCPPPPDGPYAEGAVITHATCLAGALALDPGFSCTVRQDDRANALTIGAARGGGDGLPCGEVPLYDDEAPPDGSTLLTGGPACAEVIGSINGLAAPVLRWEGGRGVTVARDPDDPHRLVVDVHLRDRARC